MPVYVIDKPLGITSHDAVRESRKLLNTRRVGHAGTLDPLATGVLVLLTHESTKLSPFLSESDKTYLAWVSFGAGTAALDSEGPIVARGNARELRRSDIEAALPRFRDLKEQLPPAYSAVKKGGTRGYEAARRGESLQLEPRPVRYRDITLLDYAPSRDLLPTAFRLSEGGRWRPDPSGKRVALPPPHGALPTALFELTVAAGTYVRAFARDLGSAVGVPAHLSGLVRTRSGRLGLERAVGLAELPDTTGLKAADALDCPKVVLSEREVERVRQGQRLALGGEGRVVLVSASNELIAVAEVTDGRMKLLRVWR